MKWVQLFRGEKDGQRFICPWDDRQYPDVFFATTASGDEELMAYRGEVPEGRKEELSVLAYQFARKVVKDTSMELQYERAPSLDATKSKPKAVKVTKKRGR
jgi:hypothetical protein